jgi:hypothetical protein
MRGDRVGDDVLLAVVAAHRTGQPLHSELVALGARVREPGVDRAEVSADGPARAGGAARGIVPAVCDGSAVEVELHRMPTGAVGALVCALPWPLAVGRVELEDGPTPGIVCTAMPAGAVDVSDHRSWPAYLAAAAGRPRPLHDQAGVTS